MEGRQPLGTPHSTFDLLVFKELRVSFCPAIADEMTDARTVLLEDCGPPDLSCTVQTGFSGGWKALKQYCFDVFHETCASLMPLFVHCLSHRLPFRNPDLVPSRSVVRSTLLPQPATHVSRQIYRAASASRILVNGIAHPRGVTFGVKVSPPSSCQLSPACNTQGGSVIEIWAPEAGASNSVCVYY